MIIMIKTEKEQKDIRYKYFYEREKKNKCIDRCLGVIGLVILGLTFILCFYNWQLAIVSFIWLHISYVEYRRGCSSLCIDEIDMPDSALGLRVMFRSWKALLPLLAIGAILVLANCPIIALFYGLVVLCLIYPLISSDF